MIAQDIKLLKDGLEAQAHFDEFMEQLRGAIEWKVVDLYHQAKGDLPHGVSETRMDELIHSCLKAWVEQ